MHVLNLPGTVLMNKERQWDSEIQTKTFTAHLLHASVDSTKIQF